MSSIQIKLLYGLLTGGGGEMMKKLIVVAIIALFIALAFTPSVSGYEIETQEDPKIEESWQLKRIILDGLRNANITYHPLSLGRVNNNLEEFKGLFFNVVIKGKIIGENCLKITFPFLPVGVISQQDLGIEDGDYVRLTMRMLRIKSGYFFNSILDLKGIAVTLKLEVFD